MDNVDLTPSVQVEQPEVIPDNIKVLSNGAWYDMEKKRIARPGAVWTQDQARQARERRYDLLRQAAEENISRSAGNGKTFYDAWGNVAARMYEIATNEQLSHSKQAVMAANQLGKMIDAFPDRRQDAGQQQPAVSMSPAGVELAREIVQLARELVAGSGDDVVDV